MTKESTTFWGGKRILITGHSGFKGGWLSLWLAQLGAEVHGLSLPPSTEPSMFAVTGVASVTQSQFGDIRDYPTVLAYFQRIRPDIVFHLAAQPLVRESYRDPVATYATNVMGTVHVLEAARQTGNIQAIVNVTTDKCYENREWVWGYREYEAMGGHDPYSSSKGCSELVTSAFRRSYFLQNHLPVATARAGNVIGGGDWSSDRLVPDLIRSFVQAKPAVIRYPDSTRPWQHVLEPLAGYLRLARCLCERGQPFADAWNFGPEPTDVRTVRWVADTLAAIWGEGARWTHQNHNDPHEATLLGLDIAKAKQTLGWAPLWNSDIAVRKTVEWYHRWQMKDDMHAVTLQQISEYQSLQRDR